jgi:hypothetical protein
VRLYKSVRLRMYDFTPLQLFYSAFRCSVTWTPAGVGVGRVGVGVARLYNLPLGVVIKLRRRRENRMFLGPPGRPVAVGS